MSFFKTVLTLVVIAWLSPELQAQNTLKIKRKQLGNLAEIARANPDANYIIIKRARLKSLPPELTLFKKLDSLDLYGNKIEQLPDSSWGMLKNVKYLRLGKNPMEEIPAGITQMEKLASLDLWNSEIFFIHPSFLSMADQIKMLDIRMTRLSRSQTQQIHDAFPNTEVKATWQCNCK